ncbi:class I SAM-dependent methyltransferase [Pontixanthobacter sp.]|uniref:class I SAM-dependent methyltransferase n=1 Tax=Pontixanthobacter sp. TaxID=2792078 RepID=UPI003C7D4E97
MTKASYDLTAATYGHSRKTEPRIAAMIDRALGSAETVLNVGAGTGSYEPAGRHVTALEPSQQMIDQRPAGAATAICASAEKLPFEDNAFDAAMAILTVHHWRNVPRGMAELRRVTSGRIVILTFDPSFQKFWLTDYVPQLVAFDAQQIPPMHDYAKWLGAVEIRPVPIPHDCADGFLGAYWRRPGAYLDASIRAGMSPFHALGDVSQQLALLKADMESGIWEARYGHLMQKDSLDCGYRLVVTV